MNELAKDTRRCSRCVYDEEIPGIDFDADGVCNYCHLHDQLEEQYPCDERGATMLHKLVALIKQAGRRKQYDCIVGISGGCDSSFLLYKTKELGLRPLAVHFDNTWNSETAVSNMKKITAGLKVDLVTHVADRNEYDDLCRSFLRAGVPDLEAATDIGLTAALNSIAEAYKISYVLNGHSFRTEGLSPIGWTYMDGKYIESIHKEYGTYRLISYPNMKLSRFLKWIFINRIRRIRPLWYIDYNKENVKQFLTDQFDWEWYGGHHLESQYTAFITNYFLPIRWGIDKRKTEFSALVRSGQMSRSDAIKQLERPTEISPDLLRFVQARLGFSDIEFDILHRLPKQSHHDFKTYETVFKRMRPLFWLAYKLNYVPTSFYIKYVAKNP